MTCFSERCFPASADHQIAVTSRVCLRDDELRALAAKGTAIVHCPLSNFYFADVLLRVQHCIDLGVLVGLGTDVAGGYSPSMLSAIRNAVITSKALRMQTLASSTPGTADADLIDWKEAFYLATMGGAAALGIQVRFYCLLLS